MLEQTVGKASGGTADIGAHAIFGVNVQTVQSGFQLVAAATDVAFAALDGNSDAQRRQPASLVAQMTVNQHASCTDQTAGLFNIVSQIPLNEQQIESLFLYPSQRRSLLQFTESLLGLGCLGTAAMVAD